MKGTIQRPEYGAQPCTEYIYTIPIRQGWEDIYGFPLRSDTHLPAEYNSYLSFVPTFCRCFWLHIPLRSNPLSLFR